VVAQVFDVTIVGAERERVETACYGLDVFEHQRHVVVHRAGHHGDHEAEPLPLEPIRSEGVALGGWRIDGDGLAPGPWLLCAWQGDVCRVQPRVVVIGAEHPDADHFGDEAEADGPDRLADIVRVPQRNRRQRLLARHVATLAASPAHAEWELLRSYLRTFQRLPASTLDVVKAVANCPRAAAMALMQADEVDFDSIWDMLEELPFAWWAVPLEDWLGAARTLHEHYVELLSVLEDGASDTARGAFSVFFSRGSERAAFFPVLYEAVKAAVFDGYSPQLGAVSSPAGQQAMVVERESARQDLLLARADEEWPQGPGVAQWKKLHWHRVPDVLKPLWLTPPQGVGFRSPVLNAPVVAALSVVLAIPIGTDLLFELHALRAFDSRWFDEAYRLTWILALATWWLQEA